MIAKALPITKGDVVSIVGSGGKTTLMFALARELVGQRNSVITTTTTRILPPAAVDSPSVVTEEDTQSLIRSAREELQISPHVTIASVRLGQKLKGLSREAVDEVRHQELADVILVEADGARHRPLKAPNENEPVVPSCTTWVLAVVGLDGIGKPNGEDTVFRPDCFARMGGIGAGETVTPKSVAQVLLHPEGLLRKTPHNARVGIILNKADIPERQEAGERLARIILEQGHGQIKKILITRLIPAPQIQWSSDRYLSGQFFAAPLTPDSRLPIISGILLAAGESRRMGRPKLLLQWGETTILEHVVDTYLQSRLHELVVVVGAEKEWINKSLEGRPVKITENPDRAKGMSTSIRCGIEAASNAVDAYLVALADQPLITPEVINLIIETFSAKRPLIAAAAHKGRRGHPVIFGKALRQELLGLQGDQGGRDIIGKYSRRTEYVEVGSDAVLSDMDTPEEYEEMRPR